MMQFMYSKYWHAKSRTLFFYVRLLRKKFHSKGTAIRAFCTKRNNVKRSDRQASCLTFLKLNRKRRQLMKIYRRELKDSPQVEVVVKPNFNAVIFLTILNFSRKPSGI